MYICNSVCVCVCVCVVCFGLPHSLANRLLYLVPSLSGRPSLSLPSYHGMVILIDPQVEKCPSSTFVWLLFYFFIFFIIIFLLGLALGAGTSRTRNYRVYVMLTALCI